ncbi:MAG: hypothetical protein ACC653_11550 [Gammaproteobacteria bacterium]
MDVSDTICNSNQKKFQFLTLKFSFVFLTLLVLSACDSGGSSGGGGGLPPERSTKETTRALCSDKIDNDSNGKIDCEDTLCLKTSVCSANKVETVDSWGDYWDGVPRAPQTLIDAEKTCKDIGGRLPTATELYRNQVKANPSELMKSEEYKTSTKDGSEKLWTSIGPENVDNQFTVNLLAVTPVPANNRIYVDVAAKTASNEYRCIWPLNDAHKLGFDERHCNGPADADKCFKVTTDLNMDVEPRAPLDYVGAAYECRLEGASIPVVADYARAIPNGLPNGSANWEFTGNAISWVNASNFGVSLVRFDASRAAHWSYDSVTPVSALRSNGLNIQEDVRFRCIGLSDHAGALVPNIPPCLNKDCFHYNNGRSHIIADNQDRNPTSYPFAINQCRALGAELPNQAEFAELIHAGWVGNDNYLWLSDPVIKTTGTINSLGNAVGKWLDIGTVNWIYSNVGKNKTNAEMRTPDTNQAYRCVWHGRIGKLPKCADDQAIERTGNTFACINTIAGNSNSKATPAGQSKPDIKGNAWDFQNRKQEDYATATKICKDLGARLPTANEIYVGRGNAPTFAITAPDAQDVTIWALNPASETGAHAVVKIVSGAVSSVADTTLQFYRCVWEATRSNVLSGRACNGPAGNSCYQSKVDLAGIVTDNDDLIADATDRVAMTMPSARAECQQAGGKLPDLREFSKLTHSSWPNGSNNLLWIDESMNWNDTGTYGYALGKWLNNATPAWQYDNALYGSKDVATALHYFRCVYSTVVR